MRIGRLVLALGLLSAFAPHQAYAQATDTAEEADLAFELGIEAYTKGDFRLALMHLLRSNRLAPNKNVLFNIARAYERLGQLESAYQRYTAYLLLEDDPADRKEAVDAIERLSKQVALVEVKSDPPGATIFVERRDLGAWGTTPCILAVPPGRTHIELDLPGYEHRGSDLVTARGEVAPVNLELVQLLGTMDVFGTDGAVLHLEGATEPLGTVPGTFTLPPGQHVLLVTAPGYGDGKRLVTVGLDGVVKVDATLERLVGKVVVDASERGALIEVDGAAAGFTPAVLDLPVGDHVIKVSQQGFEVHEETLQVATGEQIPLDVRLVRSGQLGVTVTTATKSERTTRRAPAVVTVVDREEILARGYRSVADILRTVPGFYDVYDMSTHNVAVRGVSGGARASGNIVKLMIDGQPVSYRPTTGNFFGEELVPIDAIERVEIVKGPSSALYGANAFLGVVNVITRTSGGSAVMARGGYMVESAAYGGGVTLQGGSDDVKVTVAAQYSDADRSGLNVADTSPNLSLASSPLADRGASRNDTSTPSSLLGRVAVGTPTATTGEWSAWASVQRLETGGEFFDYEPLTHQSRTSLENRTLRLGWNIEPEEGYGLEAHAVAFDSAPTDDDAIGLGRDDVKALRSVGTTGYEVGAEGRGTWGILQALAGLDYVFEHHLLQSYDDLLLADVFDAGGIKLRDEGTIIPGEGHGEVRDLTNVGAYGQAIADVTKAFSIAAGLRLDQHNIYGFNVSPRAGLVLAPPVEPWSAKLLFSTSFKAPSAEQLYTQALGPNDILGNEELGAQYARNVELAGSYGFKEVGEIEANVFYTQVIGLVEYLQHDLNLVAENAVDEDIVGGELTVRLGPTPWLNVQLGNGVALVTYQKVSEELELFGTEEIKPTYPSFQAHLMTELRAPSIDLRFAPEVTFVSSRSASQSNNVRAIGEDYVLPGYTMVSGSLSMPTLHVVSGYRTAAALRVTDVLGSQGTEPGFNGIDYPALGLRADFTLTQQF